MDLPEEVYGSYIGQINAEGCTRITTNVSGAIQGGAKTLHLLLQSSGGTIEDGIFLYNYLRNAPINIISYNVGAVQSIAVIVYLGGKIRRCSETAAFLIHKAALEMPGPQDRQLITDRLNYLAFADENTRTILRANIAMTENEWNIGSNRELHFGANDAIRYGLVHEIAEFAPPYGSRVFAM